MNVLRKQFRLSSSFAGMKKAVSTTYLSDNIDSDLYGTSHNLTLDSRSIKSKGLSTEITETLHTLFHLINDKSSRLTNENFIVDELPTNLSTDWLSNKFTGDQTKQMQQKTSAIMELLTTELNYLNQMQFFLDISSKIFIQIQSKYFPNIQLEDVFLNLGDIYEVNYRFWSNYLFPSYENALKSDEFISTKFWKDGFKEISSLFFPYQIYCSKMIQCQKYIQSLEKENKYFSQFTQWFSHLEQANRESLTDFIAKPFQRLTKYKLLLSTIAKFSENIEEQEDLEEMIGSVNLFLKQVELKISIAQISMRIDPLEIVEPPLDELLDLCIPYRNFDLTTPILTSNGEIIREIKKEGVFKMKEAQTKFFEVSCLLFTDLILICQKIRNQETDRIKVIKPIIALKKLEIINSSPGALVIKIIDDFGILTTMYLLTSDPEIIKEWVEAIHNAQILLKDITSSNNYVNDTKAYLKPRLNVTSPSPVPEEGVTQSIIANSMKSVNSKSQSLNRFSSSYNTSFIRSNFRTSPVVRKRIHSVARKPKISLSEEQSSNDLTGINRSLSQKHSAKSQLSILEDEFDQSFISGNSSLCSNDCQLSNLSIQSTSNENLEVTLSENQDDNMNAKSNVFNEPVEEIVEYDKTNNFKDSRTYKSMVNLRIDS